MLDPGKGFLVGRSKEGELSISAYALVRYINQMPADQTFTDHLGREHPVDARQRPLAISAARREHEVEIARRRPRGDVGQLEAHPGASVLGGGEGEGVEVRVEDVARRDLVARVTATGHVEPKTSIDISADVSGRIVQLTVEEGDDAMGGWLNQLNAGSSTLNSWTMPSKASGMGLNEAPRGALGHWINIDNQVIANYQMVVPSTWNACPRR